MILRIADIVPEATDIKSIFLTPADGLPSGYAAGQFLTLLFTFGDRELRRSYSFSTTPGIDPVPAICVKRVSNGEISRHLLDHSRPGDLLQSLAPAGRFTLDDQNAGNVVFIAAGSGIVPIFSLLKQVLAFRPSVRVYLLTQQHDIAGSPFRAAIRALELSCGPRRFRWTEMLTVRDGRVHRSWLEEWVLSDGLLAAGARGAGAREAGAREAGNSARFYLCGPAGFMRMAQFTLRAMGVADERIKREHFTVGHIPPAPPVFDATPKKVTIRGLTGIGDAAGGELTVTWPDNILSAALRQGILLPYSCRAGRCSSCVARCLSGRVRMSNNEVLTEKDLRDGLVLICVGYPETDVELSYAMSSEPNAIGSSEPDRGIS